MVEASAASTYLDSAAQLETRSGLVNYPLVGDYTGPLKLCLSPPPLSYYIYANLMSNTDTAQIFVANVLQSNAKDWSTVVGYGGGYYSPPLSITTHHQRVTEMWVRLSDGRDTRLDFYGDFPALPGHRAACLTYAKHIWAVRNFNSGMILWFVSAKGWAGRFKAWSYWIMPACLFIAIMSGSTLRGLLRPYVTTNSSPGVVYNPGPSVIDYVVVSFLVMAAVSLGIDALRYWRHRKRLAAYQAIIDAGQAKLINTVVEPLVPPPIPNR